MALILHLGTLGNIMLGPASSGEEALAIATRQRPELVLMDVNLEGPLDGIETARAIRKLYKIDIVFMSAFEAEIIARRAAGLEPFACIEKPFELDDIERLLDKPPA